MPNYESSYREFNSDNIKITEFYFTEHGLSRATYSPEPGLDDHDNFESEGFHAALIRLADGRAFYFGDKRGTAVKYPDGRIERYAWRSDKDGGFSYVWAHAWPLFAKYITKSEYHFTSDAIAEWWHAMDKPPTKEQNTNFLENLDDADEFLVDGPICEHCNEVVESVQPLDPYEPQYSAKVCSACYELALQGPQNDKWLEFREDKSRIIETLDDQDQFNRQYALPLAVYGRAYDDNGDNAELIYDFDDGARVYYNGTSKDAIFVLRDSDKQVRRVPPFRGGQAPDWFMHYYNGMMIASVHEVEGKGVWRGKKPIPPFTPDQRREWAQTTGRPVMESAAPPTLAQSFNVRGIVPDPADPTVQPDVVTDVSAGIDDEDEFQDNEMSCPNPEIRLIDASGADITDSIQSGFKDALEIFVDNVWVEGTPKCVVWIGAPAEPGDYAPLGYRDPQSRRREIRYKWAYYDLKVLAWVDAR